jgi:glycosyltransferase involved in cell wall biosynthesis
MLTEGGDALERAWHARWLWYALAPDDPASRPRVSVVTPVYNRADAVVEAVATALSQDWPPHEVIVADDGSSHRPDAALARFGDRVRVHRLPQNGGVAVARNAALALATGELVHFLDSDALMAPGTLAAKIAALAHVPDALLCFSRLEALNVPAGSALHPALRHIPIGSPGCATVASPAGLVYRFPFPTSSVLAARHGVLAAGGFETRLRRHEDRLLYQRMGLAAVKCIAIDRPLLQLRLREDSLTVQNDSNGNASLATFIFLNELLPSGRHWDLAALVLRQCFWRDQWQVVNRPTAPALEIEMNRFFAWLDAFAAGSILPQVSPRPLAAEFTAMLETNRALADEGHFATPFKRRLAAMRAARPIGAADLALWRGSHNPPINAPALREIFRALSRDLRRGQSWVPLAELGRRPFRSLPHPWRRRWRILSHAARLLGERGARPLARWLG